MLFAIDPRTFQAGLESAQASYDKTGDSYLGQQKQVEAVQAHVEVSRAALAQARSAIREAESQITKDKAEFQRQQGLLQQEATSVKSVDRARANYEVSVEHRKGAIASLAQRVPVRIRLGELPDGIALRVGTTSSVLVLTGTAEEGHDGSVPAAPAILQ